MRAAFHAVLPGLASLLLLPLGAMAQEAPDAAEASTNSYGSGIGVEILLTNSGFGLGGYYLRSVGTSTSFILEMSVGAGKDEREFKFFSFGRSVIPNKANFLLMLPVQMGVTQRLFRDSIEENFRPYLQVSAGPTLGWEYPYFNDENGNGRYDQLAGERTYDAISGLPKGSFRFGTGGTIALGAHFGLSKKVTQGVRVGYSFTYFFEGIQLLEREDQPPQNFFGTPTISLTFGKLL